MLIHKDIKKIAFYKIFCSTFINNVINKRKFHRTEPKKRSGYNNAIQQSFASMTTLGNCKKRQRKNKQKEKIKHRC